jgi:adenylyl-sulfate kinase
MNSNTNHPRTWWFTGLPGAGKSTLAQAVKLRLIESDLPACVLDGDLIRSGLSADLDFSPSGRTEQIRRTAEIAKLLNDQGIWVAVALVSPIRAAREMARTIIGANRFIEVYVATSLEVCVARDPKGLYAKARQDSNMGLTGAQSPFEVPHGPALVLDTNATLLGDCIDQLVNVAKLKT